jgi:hypothetical protein
MAVEPDSIFDYGFRCTHAGNFMYHCHVLTSLHLAMGMYGMVIVDPDPSQSTIYENGPNYNQEYLFMCSEINRTWSDNPVSPGLFTLYEADYLMVNGKSGSQLHDGESDVNGTVHENIALRLANIGYGSVSFSFPEALNTIAHMSDGRVLPSPFACDSLTLFPGERYTLLVNSSVPLLDSIRLTYTDLRTGLPLGENILPVNIGDNGIGLAGQSALRILGNPIQKKYKDSQFRNKANTNYYLGFLREKNSNQYCPPGHTRNSFSSFQGAVCSLHRGRRSYSFFKMRYLSLFVLLLLISCSNEKKLYPSRPSIRKNLAMMETQKKYANWF